MICLVPEAWFTLIVTVNDSACAGLSAMLATSVNQLMIEVETSARLIAKVGWLILATCRQASASTVADSYD